MTVLDDSAWPAGRETHTCAWFLTSVTAPLSRQSMLGGASKSAYLKPADLPTPEPSPFSSGLWVAHRMQTVRLYGCSHSMFTSMAAGPYKGNKAKD